MIREAGREMVILGTRLRRGKNEWDPASVFFNCPSRNMTGSSLFNDGKGKLLHFNGLEASSTWANLAITLRESEDNGATWSMPRLISPEHRYRNQVICCTIQTKTGQLIQCCDAVPGGEGGSAIHISTDGGHTWRDPGLNQPTPVFEEGRMGAWIAGIHTNVVDLTDGHLMALGRGNDINGFMPQSISKDGGTTWEYHASPFSPISGGQRLVLMRLYEGPLLCITFTDSSKFMNRNNPELSKYAGLSFKDSKGSVCQGFGMYVSLSFDDGKTWSHRRLMTDSITRALNQDRHPWEFVMDATHAEPRGYLAATQSPDGIIHLLSSGLYYRFNLAWVMKSK
jgi:hypothetical protein